MHSRNVYIVVVSKTTLSSGIALQKIKKKNCYYTMIRLSLNVNMEQEKDSKILCETISIRAICFNVPIHLIEKMQESHIYILPVILSSL